MLLSKKEKTFFGHFVLAWARARKQSIFMCSNAICLKETWPTFSTVTLGQTEGEKRIREKESTSKTESDTRTCELKTHEQRKRKRFSIFKNETKIKKWGILFLIIKNNFSIFSIAFGIKLGCYNSLRLFYKK